MSFLQHVVHHAARYPTSGFVGFAASFVMEHFQRKRSAPSWLKEPNEEDGIAEGERYYLFSVAFSLKNLNWPK